MSLKRKQKNKVPFWKKLGPEAKRVTDHIGNVIDHSTSSEIIDSLINLGLAYQGVKVTNNILGALIGPIGLKLAAGYNLIGGGAGVAILAGLGLVSVSGMVQGVVPPLSGEGPGIVCPSGYLKLESPPNSGNWICVLSPSGLY